MIKIQASVLFPITVPPIKNGIVIVDKNGRIENVIDPLTSDYQLQDVMPVEGALCPGFINSHSHLELSFLKSKIEKNRGLNSFIIQLRDLINADSDEIQNAASAQDEIMYERGVSACADIVNTSHTLHVKSNSKIYYHNFVELFGSNPLEASRNFQKGVSLYDNFITLFSPHQVSLTPHSFYAVSQPLLKSIFEHNSINNSLVSIHHLESEEEISFFLNNSGPIPERMKHFGIPSDVFIPTGKSPFNSYSQMIGLGTVVQLVHNTFALQTDINDVNASNIKTFWCLCPQSNLYIENQLPNLPLFIQNNLLLTIGTDSLASNTSLDMLSELKTLQSYFSIPTFQLLKMATLNGAALLKVEDTYGSIEKNKKPGLVQIENINLDTLEFTENSVSKRII